MRGWGLSVSVVGEGSRQNMGLRRGGKSMSCWTYEALKPDVSCSDCRTQRVVYSMGYHSRSRHRDDILLLGIVLCKEIPAKHATQMSLS